MDYRQLFQHLLHDIASGVSGLGAIVEMMALEDSAASADRAEMLAAARAAAERLRTVITGARELAKPFDRVASSANPIAVGALVKLMEGQGRRIIGISVDPAALDATVSADATLLGTMIRTLAGDGGDVSVAITANEAGVRFEVLTRSRRATSHAVDYLADCVAARHGTTVERTATAGGYSIAISLPRWTWTNFSAA